MHPSPLEKAAVLATCLQRKPVTARSQPQTERDQSREDKADVFQSLGPHPEVLNELAQQPQNQQQFPLGTRVEQVGCQRTEKWMKAAPRLKEAKKGRELIFDFSPQNSKINYLLAPGKNNKDE